MTQQVAVFAALAVALMLAVFALVLRPLWPRRDEFALLLVMLGLASFGLYRLVGTPAALDPAARRAPDTMQEAIAQLQARLREDPGQVEGWRLLGRSQAALGRPGAARDAYARAAQLAPDQPDVLVEAAESRAMAAPQRLFDAQAVALLRHALQVDPRHQRARWFLGIAQRQAGDAAAAAKTWQPLLDLVDAKTAVALREQVDDARRAAGMPPLPAATPATPAHAVQVEVKLDPALAQRARLDGNASVFVIARAPDGPPMPVAVEKHALSELPLTVTLDDADGPMPTRRLSSLDEAEVVARVSRSGNAIPQPGDLESAPVRVQLPTDKAVTLAIDQSRP